MRMIDRLEGVAAGKRFWISWEPWKEQARKGIDDEYLNDHGRREDKEVNSINLEVTVCKRKVKMTNCEIFSAEQVMEKQASYSLKLILIKSTRALSLMLWHHMAVHYGWWSKRTTRG